MITRAELARQLQLLESQPARAELRVQAAELAVRVALTLGDPSTVDVAQALLADLPEPTPRELAQRLEHLAATARATRRAIVMARAAGATPQDLAESTSAEPRTLERQVRERLDSGDSHLAGALLEVAISRHPDDPGLRALAAGLPG